MKIEKDGGDYGQEGINYFFNFWGYEICDVSMDGRKVLMINWE